MALPPLAGPGRAIRVRGTAEPVRSETMTPHDPESLLERAFTEAVDRVEDTDETTARVLLSLIHI